MELSGKNLIASKLSSDGQGRFSGVDPTTERPLPPEFTEASEGEIEAALSEAEAAFEEFARTPPEGVARFLEQIAEEIECLGDELIERTRCETALPKTRLLSERERTMAQLRLFADLVREGSWVEARLDRGQPERKPAPKPDLRQLRIPLGPVVVFSAGNFPLAFSVAGGDTASALAAGNPVVVKAHPGHPGGSEMVAQAVVHAIKACQLPAGIFSMLHGAGHEVGLALVRHPLVKAVGFTGSLAGGRALCAAARQRPVPIPVFAEMGSINPVFVLPEALAARTGEIAATLAQSATLGVGQFCTAPGLVVGLGGPGLEALVREMAGVLDGEPVGVMLSSGTADNYRARLSSLGRVPGIRLVRGSVETPSHGPEARGYLWVADAETFLENPTLAEEIFGPSALVVSCNTEETLLRVARSLSGQLAITLYATRDDLKRLPTLIPLLRSRCGRLLWGGAPTGLEVCPSMHHGGPYPACSDVFSTSVGTLAIRRFSRPVCLQNFPPDLLPVELRDDNPRGIVRLVDGIVEAVKTRTGSGPQTAGSAPAERK